MNLGYACINLSLGKLVFRLVWISHRKEVQKYHLKLSWVPCKHIMLCRLNNKWHNKFFFLTQEESVKQALQKDLWIIKFFPLVLDRKAQHQVLLFLHLKDSFQLNILEEYKLLLNNNLHRPLFLFHYHNVLLGTRIDHPPLQ